MPFVRPDFIEGRSEAQITSLLDTSHKALVSAFGIPQRDRCVESVVESGPAASSLHQSGVSQNAERCHATFPD